MRASTAPLTIGQLAVAAGVATSTVRYYERQGLVRPEARTQSNYRTYSSRTVERLKFIRAAQATGFSLKDVREMIALTHADGRPCAEVAKLIERRLEDVQRRLTELKRVSRTLSAALQSCCRGGEDWCHAVERLKLGATVSRPSTRPTARA